MRCNVLHGAPRIEAVLQPPERFPVVGCHAGVIADAAVGSGAVVAGSAAVIVTPRGGLDALADKAPGARPIVAIRVVAAAVDAGHVDVHLAKGPIHAQRTGGG